jgi:hypothetical protein
MERAVQRMRKSQFLQELAPLVEKYVPSSFAGDARSFEEWASDLDKLLDEKDPNSGTHDIGDTLISLTVSTPPEYLKAWTNAPAERRNPVYMDLSRSLQAKLKELVTFYYFSDPSRYKDLASAAAPIVYSCIPVSTTIRLNGDDEVETFNTDKDLHWDNADMKQVRAMATAPQTVQALERRLKSIAGMLRDIPSLASTAQFYAPDQIDEVIAAALRRLSSASPLPEFLGSLLFLEARLVDNAARTGTEMGRFRRNASNKPAEALKNLAEFGDEMARTFNDTIGNNPFLSGAARPLNTLLFMEASTKFDPTLVTHTAAAMLEVKVIQSGHVKVDEMLAGNLPEGIVLHEQKFVEA